MSTTPSPEHAPSLSTVLVATQGEVRDRVAELIRNEPRFELRTTLAFGDLDGFGFVPDLAIFYPADEHEERIADEWTDRHTDTLAVIVLADESEARADSDRIFHATSDTIPDKLRRVLDVLSSGRKRPKPAAQDEAKLNLLSERELEVLRLTAQGLSVSEIAAKLHRSENTVATHRRNLHRKLNLDNRVDLTRFAIRNHLADT